MANLHERRLLRVLEHIYENPGSDLSLDALSDMAAMSRFHWHRVFRALTGETLAQAVRRIRMHRASYLLVLTDRSLPDIASKVGMPNLASFARSFSEQFAMSPTALRNRGDLRPFVRNQKQELVLMHSVTSRSEGAVRLAALPHKGPCFEISRTFAQLGGVMSARDLYPSAGRMIAVHYDDPLSVPASELRSHAAFEVIGPADLSAPLEEETLPGGREAVLTYRGPYAGLPAAYDQLFGVWLPETGEEPAASPAYEVYLNTPLDAAPEDLVTEIHLPLR